MKFALLILTCAYSLWLGEALFNDDQRIGFVVALLAAGLWTLTAVLFGWL